jgi:hypothetical protein
MMQEITPYNFDEFLFEYFEGTLNEVDKKKFLDFVEQNPSYKKDMELWEQSTVANDNIDVPEGLEKLFTRKDSFWKSSKGKWTLGASVAVAILIGTVLLNKDNDSKATSAPAIEKSDKIEVQILEEKPLSTQQEYYNSANEKIKPQNSASIRTEQRKEVVAPVKQVVEEKKDNFVPSPTYSAVKTDSISSVKPNSLNAEMPKENTVIVKEEEKKKEIKPNKKNLGKAKNIVEMGDKLGEY